MKQRLLLLAAVCALTASAGTLTSVSAFTGTLSDSFESYPNYGSAGAQSSLGVFGGAATFNAQNGSIYVYEPGTANWGLASFGAASVEDGVKGLGLYGGEIPVASLDFSSAANDFGGYFAVGDGGDLTLSFYDSGSNLIGAETVTNQGNPLTWYGWTSDTGIQSIVFSGSAYPVLDNIQADIAVSGTPEPATFLFAAAGLGLSALLRRTRRS